MPPRCLPVGHRHISGVLGHPLQRGDFALPARESQGNPLWLSLLRRRPINQFLRPLSTLKSIVNKFSKLKLEVGYHPSRSNKGHMVRV